MIRGIILGSVLVSLGCGTVGYPTTAGAPQYVQARVERLHDYYAKRARELAAFTTRCDAQQATARTLNTRLERILMDNVAIERAQIPESVGVDACGQRLVYRIVCGPKETYASDEAICADPTPGLQSYCARQPNYNDPSPCEVLLDGSPAMQDVIANNEAEAAQAAERAEAEAQAARAAEAAKQTWTPAPAPTPGSSLQ